MSGPTTGLLGLGVILVTATLMLGLSWAYRNASPVFRNIAAYVRLRRAVGRVVEDGTRLHVSLGRNSLIMPQSASALMGLTFLRRLADSTSASDHPPIATSGDSGLAVLSQDALHASAQNVPDFTSGRLAGLTPFSYAAGAGMSIREEKVSANVLMGNFGVEAGLLTDMGEHENTFTLAASDNLTAQAVTVASADEALVGEELFAAGAYTGAGRFHIASLVTQDVLRWLVVATIVVGSLLKLIGFL